MHSDFAIQSGRSPRSITHISQLTPARPALEAAPNAPLALYCRPARVSVLTRDRRLVSELSAALPLDSNLTVLPTAESCLQLLELELGGWERHYKELHHLVDSWRAGAGGLPALALKHLTRPDHARLTSVLIADYHLLGFDGLQQLNERMNWQGARLLLTGLSDALALATFREGWIDQVWSKASSGMLPAASTVVQDLMRCPDDRAGQILSSTLSDAQEQLLAEATIAQDLVQFARHAWRSWVCIGEPFGLLGIEHSKAVAWLQLQPTDDLEAAAHSARAHGLTPKQLEQVRTGQLVSTCGLRASLALMDNMPLAAPAFQIGQNGSLLGTLITLAHAHPPLHNRSTTSH